MELWQWLAGEFRNTEQALSDPAWFVHVCLWQRPFWLDGQSALFLEQANVLKLDQPYRQRVMQLQDQTIQFYALKEPQHWRGAGAAPERLLNLQSHDLELLPSGVLQLQTTATQASASMSPGALCQFSVEGVSRYVVLGFRVTATTLETDDRGVDPDTGRSLWGAIMGPYCYQKVTTYSLPSPTAPARG